MNEMITRAEYEELMRHLAELEESIKSIRDRKAFAVQDEAPNDTNILWIDTTPKTGGTKYHNGSEWVPLPVMWL